MKDNPDNAARGWIVWVLKTNDAITSPMSFRNLLRGLDNVGQGRSAREFHPLLDYLEGKGYVRCSRRRDIPGFERQRTEIGGGRASDIISVKLTPRGLDLAQSNIADDPGVDLP